MFRKIFFTLFFVMTVALYSESVNFQKGVEFQKNGDLKQAEKYYKMAVKENDLKAMYNLSLLYKSQGKNELAEKYFMMVMDSEDTLVISSPGEILE